MEVAWKRGADLPRAIEGFSAVSVENFGFYIFGGVDTNGVEQNKLYHYSPTNRSWRMLKSSIACPEPRSNCSIISKVENGKVLIYVFGGLNCEEGWKSSAWKGTVEDAGSVNWTEIKHDGEEFTARDKMTVVLGENCCYLIGGFGPIDCAESEEDEDEDIPESIKAQRQAQQAMTMGWFDEVVKFDLKSETFDVLATKGIDGAAGKAASSGFMDKNGIIYIFGGRSMKGRTDKMFSINPKSQIWEEEKPGGFPPAARSFLAAGSWNNSFYIFGGQGRNDELLGGLHKYSDGKWSKIESSETNVSPRRQSQLLSYNNKIYLLGGSDNLNPETGINNVLTEIWEGDLQKRKTENGDHMASLGLKRKSN